MTTPKGWPIGILRAKADYAAKGTAIVGRTSVGIRCLPLKLLNQLKFPDHPCPRRRNHADSKTGFQKICFPRLLHWSVSGRCACQILALDNLKLKKRRSLPMLLPNTTKHRRNIKDVYEKNGGRCRRSKPTHQQIRIFSSQLTKIKQAGPELIFLPKLLQRKCHCNPQAKTPRASPYRLSVPIPGVRRTCVKLCGKDLHDYYFEHALCRTHRRIATKKFIATIRRIWNTRRMTCARPISFGLPVAALKTAGKNDRQAVRTLWPEFRNMKRDRTCNQEAPAPVLRAPDLKIKGWSYMVWMPHDRLVKKAHIK